MIRRTLLMLGLCCATGCQAGPSEEDRGEIVRLNAVRDTLRVQIDAIRADSSIAPESLVGALHRMRLEMLTLTDDMLRQRAEALAAGASFEYQVQAAHPNAQRADSLARELVAQRDSLTSAIERASEFDQESLVGAFGLLELQTRRLTISMLDMTRLAAQYGLSLPTPQIDPALQR